MLATRYSASSWSDNDVQASTTVLLANPFLSGSPTGSTAVFVPAGIDHSWLADFEKIRGLVTAGKSETDPMRHQLTRLLFESPTRARGEAVFGDGGILMNPHGSADYWFVKENEVWRIERFSAGS